MDEKIEIKELDEEVYPECIHLFRFDDDKKIFCRKYITDDLHITHNELDVTCLGCKRTLAKEREKILNINRMRAVMKWEPLLVM
jgi:hypothetical protein